MTIGHTELPTGGSIMTVDEYVSFVRTGYLEDFVGHGGAGVKFVVLGGQADPVRFSDLLNQASADFVHATVDAAETRMHLIDQIFVAVACAIDWDALTTDAVAHAYEHVGFPVDNDTSDLRVDTIAAHHGVDPGELYRSVRRNLEQTILGDPTLAHDFRVAMLRLAQAVLGRNDVAAAERDDVLSWLRGDKVPAARLRAVSLTSKIARHNARALLLSLARWVRRVGRPGLVLQLDVTRVAVARRPPLGARDGLYYSKAAALDVYEVLRQVVDATDDLDGVFVAVIIPPDMMTDESRGLPAYSALHLRVADEVRDRRRANPYASLVRLGVRLEAVR